MARGGLPSAAIMGREPGIGTSDVLEVDPPTFSEAEAAEVAERVFGVSGSAAALASERDQNFLIDDGAGGRGVMKISNSAEDAAILDMETEAALHLKRADPELPVAMPRPVPGSDPTGGAGAYRTTVEGPNGSGSHHVRMFDHMPGTPSVSALELDHDALWDLGAVVARLGRALRGFFHPRAGRVLLWDIQHAAGLRPLAAAIEDPRRRAIVERVLDRFEEQVLPLWPQLRAQVIHGDASLDNMLTDERRRVSGIVDFGDMSHTALACDISSVWASVLGERSGEEFFRAAAALLDGYQTVTPLEEVELSVISDLLATRAAAAVSISAVRVARYPGNDYIASFEDEAWPVLELYAELGPEEASRRLGGRTWSRPVPIDGLMERRREGLGSALTAPSYEQPLHLVAGKGVWMFDPEGRRYLDAYNNVPVAGHCNPRVTEALVRQARSLNTNMRYLHEAVIELAERLVDSMPAGSGLDMVMMVNSGSEANDLAWRLARTATQNAGAIVSDYAYHGISAVMADLSPEEWATRRPGYVETFPPPDSYRGAPERLEHAAELAHAAGQLADRGIAPAAVFVDGAFTSDGIFRPSPAYMRDLVARVREAGALYVADEVQVGHGRTGEHLWSFAAAGIVPDVVTIGKPMGNGYPVAAIITRSEIVDRLAGETSFFSTFGGNPPAAVAALAVLDAIRDQELVGRAASIGEELRRRIEELAERHVAIGDVRGWGLLIGVELVVDRESRSPDPELADRVVNAMRDRGVLIGRTGRHENVLKVRPPLVFGPEHVDLLVRALDDALGAATASAR